MNYGTKAKAVFAEITEENMQNNNNIIVCVVFSVRVIIAGYIAK